MRNTWIDRKLSRLSESLLPLRAVEAARWTGPATISVVCDDGYLDDFDHIAPVLEALGARGVFAITPALVGRPRHMETSQVAELAARGHEIAGHMLTHMPVTAMRAADRLQHMHASQSYIRALGGDATTLVYPFGSNDRSSRMTAAQIFSLGVTAWPGINLGRINRFALRRVAVGAFEDPHSALVREPRVLLENLRRSSGWLILMLHAGSALHRPEHTARLREFLSAARASAIPIRTTAQAAQEHLRPLHAAQAA